MPINSIQANKLLRFLCYDDKKLQSKLRDDIRNDIDKAEGKKTGGGHFQVPFWSDVKSHMLGKNNLSVLTKRRVNRDSRRTRLYPLLAKGALSILNQHEDVASIFKSPQEQFSFSDIDLTIRVEHTIDLMTKNNRHLAYYPYWFDDPKLPKDIARIGLWLLDNILSNKGIDNIHLFDIIHQKDFALSNYSLMGDEEDLLRKEYQRIYDIRKQLMEKMLNGD